MRTSNQFDIKCDTKTTTNFGFSWWLKFWSTIKVWVYFSGWKWWSVIELRYENDSIDSGWFRVNIGELSGSFERERWGIKFWNIMLALVVINSAFMLLLSLKFHKNLNWRANESIKVNNQILNLWVALISPYCPKHL